MAELSFLESLALSALWVPPVLIYNTSNAALFIGFRSPGTALISVLSLSSSSSSQQVLFLIFFLRTGPLYLRDNDREERLSCG